MIDRKGWLEKESRATKVKKCRGKILFWQSFPNTISKAVAKGPGP